jgi:hypothetical protein
MLKFEKTVSTAVILGALLVTLSACQKKEGPAEEAGKQIDQTTEKVGEQIEKTGDQIQDAAKGDKD